MRVIGTAGHVDHGKSTLVKRLTNIDPDRLIEEKKREMTIDLGFAWLELSGNGVIGIVDVPGHRDFIENMLAGVGGIDAVILIIAADEGIMPQTREHLDIIDLLGIRSGIIALTKIDMIDDIEWLELVEQDVREVLDSTCLEHAPIIPVSAYTGDGLHELTTSIESLVNDLPPHIDKKRPKLPIDRVFTISGFGTVVTGTLLDGSLHIGDEIELQPSGLTGRIRGLQSYKQGVSTALPGSRVAVNVTGIEKSEVTRGDVLTYPGQIHATRLADVHFKHLSNTDYPLKHNAEVKVFSGTAETTAQVRLLNDEVIPPGGEGWLQLRTNTPMPLSKGDHYILRYPSPPQTIGGGVIVEPYAKHKWKRFQPTVIQKLNILLQGTPVDLLAQAASGSVANKPSHLQNQIGLDGRAFQNILEKALNDNLLIQFKDNTIMSTADYINISDTIIDLIEQFHQNEPLRLGISKEEIRSRLNLKLHTINVILEQLGGIIQIKDNQAYLDGHTVRFSENQQRTIDSVIKEIEQTPYTPPSYSQIEEKIGKKLLRALIELGKIIQVTSEVIFLQETFDEMVSTVLEIIQQKGNVDAKQVRDEFSTSRKYAIALLEYLDSQNITKRVGDIRVKGRNAWQSDI